MKILEKISKAIAGNLPFVVYRKPNANVVSGFFQQDDSLFTTTDYTESGFVFAPFDDKDSSILIPKSKSDFFQEEIAIDNFSVDTIYQTLNGYEEDEKQKHIKLVEDGIAAIKNQQFTKVVLSRKEIAEVIDLDIVLVYKRLLAKYPKAFVYIWFHPQVGLWLGATPETLLKINGNKFETMSLAGTQLYKGSVQVTWQEKELEEQQVVTDYIVENLKSVCNDVIVSELETVRAGNLLHLRTKISGEFTTHFSKLIAHLHPTPAVCGFPKLTSKKFILDTENYNREFYTGFLGELNLPNSELYVNLRCMQIKDKQVIIYVGGGVTKDSNSSKEWDETIAKSKTIKNIL